MEQINQVWKLLPVIAPRYADMIFSEACRLLNTGWSVADTVGFLSCLSCLQEAGCEMDKSEALAREVLIMARNP